MIEAGVDEVGRGPLAGPVISAAVILDSSLQINGLDDSKKLSEKKRLELDIKIKKICRCMEHRLCNYRRDRLFKYFASISTFYEESCRRLAN